MYYWYMYFALKIKLPFFLNIFLKKHFKKTSAVAHTVQLFFSGYNDLYNVEVHSVLPAIFI